MSSNKIGTWSIETINGRDKYTYDVTYNDVEYRVRMGRSSKNYWIHCQNIDTNAMRLRGTKRIGITNESTTEEVKTQIMKNMSQIYV